MRRDVFQAIADPVRRDIIDLLAEDSLTVNAVAEKFEISRPAISKHIKILSECGLVKTISKGRERHCIIVPEELSRVSAWVERHRKLWEQKLDSFEEYLNELKRKNEADERDK
ncbi:winged helix-turn-helix transcriptional regulator [Fulvivirga sp. M361]|uniref:ArsR/SmtB family transcription factor n=1 Tax=Fulvivirga sp. M361 TaxID=2594266 RepID=UPI00117B17A4|nr:metalloregulator ArsR/SmtB family transcription factor [Fulvivirga sp. M361]TRX48699.1 winged helix-turn-helix transcriptional regulator [Fulvivirga sp. M361]